MFTGTVDCNDTTQARQCYGFGMAGREGDSVSKLVNPRYSYSPHLCTAATSWVQCCQIEIGFPQYRIYAIFKTGRNVKSNIGHFYINFKYKTHPNFGGNFSKKKVRLIVRKIRYTSIFLNIQGVTGPHRQNDRDDRPCREDHFFWRNIYSQTRRLWVMRRWRCSPVSVGIEYKQLYTYHIIEKGMFLQYVFKQSALCLTACLISSQQR